MAVPLVASGTVLAEDREPGRSSAGGGLKTTASLEVAAYADTDHVSVLTPTLAAGLADDVAGWSIGGRYLVDVVSAASVDVVSNASSRWTEVRQVGSGNGSLKIDDVTLGASGIYSHEGDYVSLTYGGTLSADLLEKNLTPYVGFSAGEDQVGRTGLPREYWHNLQRSNLQVGATWVVDRSTIASVQIDGVFERGYLAKPYRYIPMFAPGQAASIPAGASIDLVNSERRPERPAEQVPSARDRYALSGRLAHRFDGATLRLDERLYRDSWGVMASTSDLRYLFDLGRHLTLWPHLRYHVQKEATFWQRAYELVVGSGGALGIPVFRTGDRELSPFNAWTLGAGARWRLTDDTRKVWSLVFELDGTSTHFLDTLYIAHRTSFFSTLAIEADLD